MKSNILHSTLFVLFGILALEVDRLLFRSNRFDYTVFLLLLQYLCIAVYLLNEGSHQQKPLVQFSLQTGRTLQPISTCFVMSQLMFMNAKVGVDVPMMWSIAHLLPMLCYRPSYLIKEPLQFIHSPILILLSISGFMASSDIIISDFGLGALIYGASATGLMAMSIMAFCERNRHTEEYKDIPISRYLFVHSINAIFMCAVYLVVTDEYVWAFRFLINTPHFLSVCHNLVSYVVYGAVSTICLFKSMDTRSPARIAVGFTIMAHSVKFTLSLPTKYRQFPIINLWAAFVYRYCLVVWTLIPVMVGSVDEI